MNQRRIDHPGDVWQKYVDELTDQECIGTGSSEQDLTGDVMRIRRISSCVVRKRPERRQRRRCAGENRRPAVSKRTLLTFRTKKVAKLSAMWSVVLVTSRCRPSSVDSELQSIVDDRPQRSKRIPLSFGGTAESDRYSCVNPEPAISVDPRFLVYKVSDKVQVQ